MSLLDPALLRPAIFGFLLLLLLGLEAAFPRRRDAQQRIRRWPVNLSLALISSALLALLPIAALGTAWFAEAEGIGLFHAFEIPAAPLLTWLLLDLSIYWQHRWMHEMPWLWRLHRVHHSDPGFDTSTGLRFHPFEILLSMFWKMSVVLLLGASPWVVLIFELMLSAFALFSHANLRVPGDAWLRVLLVTPDFHRLHHSVRREETDSHYGSVLTLWDRGFGSYRVQPKDGQLRMRLGLETHQDISRQTLPALLRQPLD